MPKNYYITIIFGICWLLISKTNEIVVETNILKPLPSLAIERRYIGTLKTEHFSLLSPKSSGTIASIHIKAGQEVNQGDLLISLKSHVEKSSLALAEKNLHSLLNELKNSQKLLSTNDISKAEIIKLEREINQAKLKLAEQKHALDNVEIRAPFAGVVGVPRVVLGESVNPNTSLISLVKGPYVVFINLPRMGLHEVKVGQKVRIKSYTSHINAVEKTIDPITRLGFAKASFTECAECIILDSIFVYITVYEKNNVLLLPKKAIFFKDGQPYAVLIKTKDNLKKAEIIAAVLGEEWQGQYEIISGLNANDEVVIANPKRIAHGSLVKVIK